MQGAINGFRQFSADTVDSSKRIDSGIAHTLQAAEVFKQLFAALGADSGDVFQGGLHARFAAFGAVAGDGEAVRFVAHLLDQVKAGMVFGQAAVRDHRQKSAFPGRACVLRPWRRRAARPRPDPVRSWPSTAMLICPLPPSMSSKSGNTPLSSTLF